MVDEFSNTFTWSYDELKGIPREMIEHRSPLIPGAKPIRQKEKMMNPQLQLLVRAERERNVTGWIYKARRYYSLGFPYSFGEEEEWEA